MGFRLVVRSRAPLGAYDVRLAFDPSRAGVAGIEGGNAHEFAAPPVANDPGDGTLRLAGFQGATLDGPVGDVHVATVVLRRLGRKPARLRLASVALFDTTGGSYGPGAARERSWRSGALVPPHATPAGTSPGCGDVTGNGRIDIADALAVAQVATGLRACTTALAQPTACDVSPQPLPDGRCNITDALRIAQCSVGISSCTFSCSPFGCTSPFSTCVPTGQACACGAPTPTQLEFTTVVPASGSVCGSTNGAPFSDLLCGSLYFGGGLNATSLPANLVDRSVSLTSVTACAGQCLALTKTTSQQTGTDRNCTAAGCLFGAPLPVVNTQAPFLSTCIVNHVSRDATGEADCATGSTQISLPLTSELFLTGDLDGDPDNGTQPCPVCKSNGTENVCVGGPNDAQPCTPETSDETVLGEAFPTSQDCPPPPDAVLGALPIPFALTTGVSSKTASPSGTETRVFCGFCRDQDNPIGSMTFAKPPVPCTSNADCAGIETMVGSCADGDTPGAACSLDADCPGGGTCTGQILITFDSCEQRDDGCFGDPNCTTVAETGTAGGSLAQHTAKAATLVSVFCIPPAYNGAIDSAAGLPGPGAASLAGTLRLLP